VPVITENPIAVFDPLPWQIEPWRYTGPVMLLTGSAGGGKSRLAAEKLHAFCLKYPGSQAVALRKNRSTMTNGTIPFLERVIMGAQDTLVRHVPSRFRFEYANGSKFAYIGLEGEEGRKKLRSFGQDGGIDAAWVEEAVECEYEDYNELKTRMRGKAAWWRQIILTTNPESDLHWINTSLILGGGAKVFFSQSKDNPYNPEDYNQNLATMTGVRAERMREGKWVRATGLVYDQWLDDYGQVEKGQEQGNVTELAEYLPDNNLPVYWGVDDGYSPGPSNPTGIDPNTHTFVGDAHPRVFLLAQVRPDGRLSVFAESYAVKVLPEQHLDEILALPYPAPELAFVDGSAADMRGRIQNKGFYTRNGTTRVEEGIKALQTALSPDANGVRQILIHPRCYHLRRELNAYRRDPATEKPIKQFDHGPDTLRYLFNGLKSYLGS
jgi:hypothetical protein